MCIFPQLEYRVLDIDERIRKIEIEVLQPTVSIKIE